MRGKILGWLAQATPWGLVAVLALLTAAPIPTGAFTDDPSAPNQGQRTEQDRCKFMMENVRAIVLSLNREGEITFLNHYGQSFFGYSEMEVLGKPMLGTLTPLTGFGGRDMAAFFAELVRHRIAMPSAFMKICSATASGSRSSGPTRVFSTTKARCGKFSGSAWT
jgi:PAS domain-containing protein